MIWSTKVNKTSVTFVRYIYTVPKVQTTLFYLYFTCLISWSSTSMAYLETIWTEMNNLQNASCRFLRKGLGLVTFWLYRQCHLLVSTNHSGGNWFVMQNQKRHLVCEAMVWKHKNVNKPSTETMALQKQGLCFWGKLSHLDTNMYMNKYNSIINSSPPEITLEIHVWKHLP